MIIQSLRPGFLWLEWTLGGYLYLPAWGLRFFHDDAPGWWLLYNPLNCLLINLMSGLIFEAVSRECEIKPKLRSFNPCDLDLRSE